MSARWGWLLAACLVVGCTHTETAPETAPRRFALTFMAGRQGELEPCGCHARPLGGVAREWNARASVRQPGIPEWSLASGPQFLSAQTVPARDYAVRRAGFITDAWNALGVEVAAADARDFAYGEKVFEAIRRNTRSQWVSANLYSHGKRVFPAFTTRVFAPHTVQVFGASGCQGAIAGTVECREPIAALKAAIAAARPNGIVVLLASLDDETLAKVLKEIPQIAIVLNSPSDIALPGVVEEPGHRWLANPTPRGRALVRMEITDGDTAKAAAQTIWIDKEFEEPTNPLRALVENWRAAQHEAELRKKD